MCYLFHQSGGVVPGDVGLVEIVQELGAVPAVLPIVRVGGEVGRQTAATVQFHVDETGRMRLIDKGFVLPQKKPRHYEHVVLNVVDS